jgi:hypothetical protein
MDKRSKFLVLMVVAGGGLAWTYPIAALAQSPATQPAVASAPTAGSSVLVTRGSELVQVQFESRAQPTTSERIADVPRVTHSSLPELQTIARPAGSSLPKAERYYSAPERQPIQGIELVNR